MPVNLNNSLSAQQPTDKKKAWHWYRTWWGISFMVIALAMLLVLTYVAWRVLMVFATNIEKATQTNSDTIVQAGPSGITADDPYFGNTDASITIVEFGDFECPACQESASIFRQVMNDYSDKVLFQYRDFPVVDLHQNSVKAGEAGECAHDQGKFWPMYEKLFENQNALSVSDLKNYAVQIGLDADVFNACLDSGVKAAEVSQDLMDGVTLSQNLTEVGTPLFVINGYAFAGTITAEKWHEIIDDLIDIQE